MKTNMTLMLLGMTLLLTGCAGQDPLVVVGKNDTGKTQTLAYTGTDEAVPAGQTSGEEILPPETEAGELLPEADIPEDTTNISGTATVYICGAVASPGVVTVESGARVLEAVTLAGGLTNEADDTWINLAQPVEDGWMIRIRTRQETDRLRQQGLTPVLDRFGIMEQLSAAAGTLQTGSAALQKDPVNINTAGVSQLVTLPGIGEAKAESIIAYRQRNGLFTGPEQIVNVSGIGPSVYEKIRLLICV